MSRSERPQRYRCNDVCHASASVRRHAALRRLATRLEQLRAAALRVREEVANLKRDGLNNLRLEAELTKLKFEREMDQLLAGLGGGPIITR
jgi:hypothetical protein